MTLIKDSCTKHLYLTFSLQGICHSTALSSETDPLPAAMLVIGAGQSCQIFVPSRSVSGRTNEIAAVRTVRCPKDY